MNQPAKSILMLYVSNDNGVQLPLKFRPKKSPLGGGLKGVNRGSYAL